MTTSVTATPGTKKYKKLTVPDYDVAAHENDKRWIAQGKGENGSDQAAEIGDMILVDKTGTVMIMKKADFEKQYKAVDG